MYEPTSQRVTPPNSENPNHYSAIILPFIAPPSSPTYFLQSDPPSATQSPTGLHLAPLSVHAFSSAPIFTIGPYAHETQLVSPPVFSTFTTEPSTASFTPPPELIQMTTPSPEVSFAQLLSSSLARNKRNNGAKYPFSSYEFIPYQYPGSPGVSYSGTSSPDKRCVIEFRMGEASKFVGYEHLSNYKWGSRVGSGSLTPNGWVGLGNLTANGGFSRLGSGSLTPNRGSKNDESIVDHGVSFELDIPSCIVKELIPSDKISSRILLYEAISKVTDQNDPTMTDSRICIDGETANEVPNMGLEREGDEYHEKHRAISLSSSKDFNFNSAKGEVSEKSTVDCEWWTNEKIARNELGPQNSWTFSPVIQSGSS